MYCRWLKTVLRASSKLSESNELYESSVFFTAAATSDRSAFKNCEGRAKKSTTLLFGSLVRERKYRRLEENDGKEESIEQNRRLNS